MSAFDHFEKFSDFLAASGVQMDDKQVETVRVYALYLSSLVRRYGWHEAASLLDRLIFSLVH